MLNNDVQHVFKAYQTIIHAQMWLEHNYWLEKLKKMKKGAKINKKSMPLAFFSSRGGGMENMINRMSNSMFSKHIIR